MYAQQIRFDNSPKLHLLNTDLIYPVDSWVVSQSRRGLELARVRGDAIEVQGRQKAGVILREATPEDLERAESLRQEAADLKWILRTKVRGRKLPVKIVALEYTLDGALLTIAYSAETRIDLGTLISDVRAHTSAKVNFSAIGPREQTQILGALGACGRETCSSSHLQDFAPVTIKMARDQQLPLNPDKLSGPCGRLLCCLQYEHGMYQELLRDFPRRGSKACQISTGVVGKVGKINPLKGTVELYTENGMLELKNEDVERMGDGGSARED